MRRFTMRPIPWSPWDLSLALLGNTRPEKTQGELAGAREPMEGCVKELGV
jgi:hypothetical protein